MVSMMSRQSGFRRFEASNGEVGGLDMNKVAEIRKAIAYKSAKVQQAVYRVSLLVHLSVGWLVRLFVRWYQLVGRLFNLIVLVGE